MSNKITENQCFLRSIYNKRSKQRAAFACCPQLVGAHEHPYGDFTLSDKPVELWVDWVLDNYNRWLELNQKVGDDGVPVARLSTGTHIYATAFGCDVHCPENDIPFALKLVNNPSEADKIQEPNIWNSPSVYRIFELAGLVQKKLGPDVPLSVPDMQTGFDTASLIWEKEDMLCSMVLAPESVKQLTAKCARFLKKFIYEFRKEFPNTSPCHCPLVWAPPEMGPWVSNDECGAFNRDMFEEFCLPELVDLSETFGSIGMHCCADAEHQFPAFRKIPNFYAFNRVEGKKGYNPAIEFFSDVSDPVHVLAWLPDDTIADLLNRSSSETRFIFNYISSDSEESKRWYDKFKKYVSKKGLL